MISYTTILANGGATVNRQGQAVTLKSGYQVSKQDVAAVAVESFTQKDIERLVAMLKQRGEYAGFWVDGG